MLSYVLVVLSTTTVFSQPTITSDIVSEAEMIFVEGGTFEMGSNTGERNEKPVHSVTVNSFYMGQYEVTQSLWQKVMGNNPSYFKNCEECPVEEATPKMIDEFLNKLNLLTGKKYRLPTEAEWEYAAMGGNKSKGYRYSGSDSLLQVAWVKENADNRTHKVGQLKPNELGIYDMSGNVWELCSDWWNPGYYKNSSTSNPLNDKKAIFRLTRGGSWRSGEERCYCKARNRNVYDHHKQNCGLRLVLDQ